MVCPNCNTPFDRDSVFCGNCGKQVAPLRAPGTTVGEPVIRSNVDNTQATEISAERQPYMRPPLDPSSAPTLRTTPPVEPANRSGASPAPSPGVFPGSQAQKANRRTGRNIFIAFLLLLLVCGAAAGTNYYAWLVDVSTEKVLPLGALTAQGQNFSLNFSGKTNLLGAGNELEITQEKGTPSLPSGKIVLSGTFPPLAFIHIRHLLFSFGSTPGKVGLLVGLREQAQALNGQATLLKSLTNKGPEAVRCDAQNIVNLVEGAHGHNTQPLNPVCSGFNVTNAGDGFGLFDPNNANGGYVILAGVHAALAATQADTTDTIRQHASRVQIATDNLKKWLTNIDNDAHQLTIDPTNTALIQDIATLSDHALNGFDLNDNGQIDPIPGEAGAVTAYDQGQLMAQLPLAAGGS